MSQKASAGGLARAAIVAVALGAGVVFLLVPLVWVLLLSNPAPYHLPRADAAARQQFDDTVNLVFLAAAGIGGLIGLVVTYRRQSSLESEQVRLER